MILIVDKIKNKEKNFKFRMDLTQVQLNQLERIKLVFTDKYLIEISNYILIFQRIESNEIAL